MVQEACCASELGLIGLWGGPQLGSEAVGLLMPAADLPCRAEQGY